MGMLVLHRRPNERIALILEGGEEVWLEVTDCGRQGARLGITAPDDVRILRSRRGVHAADVAGLRRRGPGPRSVIPIHLSFKGSGSDQDQGGPPLRRRDPDRHDPPGVRGQRWPRGGLPGRPGTFF
jgi:hypothetical protein